MTELINILHAGSHSLVIRRATGVIETFDRRGVADLHVLYHDPAHPLQGAEIADKVVGIGAAALMVAGRAKRCHTDVISSDALILMKNGGVDCSYGQEVMEIINRAGTGRCPLERRLAPLHNLERMLSEIDRFVDEIKHSPVSF